MAPFPDEQIFSRTDATHVIAPSAIACLPTESAVSNPEWDSEYFTVETQ